MREKPHGRNDFKCLCKPCIRAKRCYNGTRTFTVYSNDFFLIKSSSISYWALLSRERKGVGAESFLWNWFSCHFYSLWICNVRYKSAINSTYSWTDYLHVLLLHPLYLLKIVSEKKMCQCSSLFKTINSYNYFIRESSCVTTLDDQP